MVAASFHMLTETAKPSLTASYVGTNNSNVAASSFTFTAQGIGSAAASRIVVVAVHCRGNANISSVTVGGTSATLVVSQQNPGSGVRDTVAIYQVPVASGTTADIVVTMSASTNRLAIGVFNITGGVAATALNTYTSTANPGSSSVLVRPGGCIIAGAYDGSGLAHTCTWAGVTEQYDVAFGDDTATAGFVNSSTLQTALTVSSTFSGAPGDPVQVAAAW
jgi:hypothetical protein